MRAGSVIKQHRFSSRYRFYDTMVGISSNVAGVVEEVDRLYDRFRVPRGTCDLVLKVSVRNGDVALPSNFLVEAVVREGCDCANFLIKKHVYAETKWDGHRIFKAGFGAEPWDWLGHIEACIFYFALRNLKGFLQIHAGVVAMGGVAVILPGGSGVGKTTLACLLVRSGFKYLSDELALIDFKSLKVLPFPRCPMVRADVSHLFGANEMSTASSMQSFGASKHFATLRPSKVQAFDAPLAVGRIVLPRYAAHSGTRMEAISAREVLVSLFEGADICNLSQDDERSARAMEAASRLVEKAPGYRLTWSDGVEAAELIKELVASGGGLRSCG